MIWITWFCYGFSGILRMKIGHNFYGGITSKTRLFWSKERETRLGETVSQRWELIGKIKMTKYSL